MKNEYLAIGLMSGTSADGVDAAIIKTDGHINIEILPYCSSYIYPENIREDIFNAYKGVGNIEKLESDLTEIHAQIVYELLDKANLSAKDIDVIGFHGHTILHKPEENQTWQIGDGRLLAETTSIDVVYDLRSLDVENGGQGAPLVPIYHKILAKDLNKPVVFVNIGGVSNVTYIGSEDDDLLAFDTGPGNALIDDLIRKANIGNYDDEGNIALKGVIDKNIVERFLSDPYFAKIPPKSLDRNSFNIDVSGLSLEDGVATLTACTAESIAKSLDFFSHKPIKWVIAGGGRKNKAIMGWLEEKVGVDVISIDEMQIDGDMIEAQAFAYLAVRSIKNLPITFPKTTGVAQKLSGGVFCQASRA
ncbi:anhydro-N-acetylmuramic acid kinase [Rickettsiales bacterium]|nr:anhydro-N-acetylmuramic acid kinase [Rickettsiales bacterium]